MEPGSAGRAKSLGEDTGWSVQGAQRLNIFAGKLVGSALRLHRHSPLFSISIPIFVSVTNVGLGFDVMVRRDKEACQRSYDALLKIRGEWAIVTVDLLLGMLSHAIGDVSKAVHYLEDSLAFCARTATYPNMPRPAGVTLPFCWSARVARTTSGRRSCWKKSSKSRQTWGCHLCANRWMT